MVKITPQKIKDFLKNPDKDKPCILIYGPDFGLVSQRVKAVINAVLGENYDPLNKISFSFASLKEQPTKLMDEFLSKPFFSGTKIIRIRDLQTSLPKEFETILTDCKGENKIIFEAADLSPSSSLRKFFEKATNAAAIACYKKDTKDINLTINTILKQQGFSCTNDVRALLTEKFYGDSLVLENEIEKLLLYMGDNKYIEFNHVEEIIMDCAEMSLMALSHHVANKKPEQSIKMLNKAFQEEVAVIGIIRILFWYFSRLLLVKNKIAQGNSHQDAINTLKPPVFYKELPVFKNHLNIWTQTALEKIIVKLYELETLCKQTGNPPEILCSQLILSLALTR